MPYKIEKRGEKFVVMKKEGGKVVGTHDTMDKAKKQLAALNINVKEDLMWTQTLHIKESGEEGASKSKWCKIGGVALTPTLSVNGRQYTINAIKENSGSEVSVFSEHRPIEDHVVGKVSLIEEDGVLRYDGNVRNTSQHPDIVEKCQDNLLKVSIGASEFSYKEDEDSGNMIIESLKINHLGLVGIAGVKDVTMEYAIAESVKMPKEEQKDKGEDEESEKVDGKDKKSKKKKEENKMEEVEKLKKQLKEAQDKVEALKVEKKKTIVESIVEMNKDMKKEELMEKDESELKVMESYEKKLKELKENGEGAAEGQPAEGEGNGEAPEKKDEGEVKESDELKGIIVEKDTKHITMDESLNKRFNKELFESVYR